MASSSAPPLLFPLSGSAVSIVRRSAPTLLNILQTRFQCEAEILGLDLDSTLSPRPHVVPEKRLETTLPSGVKVSVWKADLTNFSAAAVVNAANTRLSHYGGLAQALSEAGGHQVQTESDDYVKMHGELKTGDAVALTAGKLKCDVIIHTVGPRLSFRPNAHEVSAAKPLLKKAVWKVLEIVETKQLETVAIPAVSSGIFNFPVDECAEVIIDTLKSFYSRSNSHRFKPKEVLLVNNDEPTVKEMEKAFVKLLSVNSPVSSNQTSPTGNKPHTSANVLYSQAAAGGSKPHNSSSGLQTRGAKSKTAPPEVQLGPVRLLLRKGCLEDQKMDVIVNTIGTDKRLDVGLVSSTLLKKAGDKMQKELYSAPLRGTVYITKGYALNCKEVYHCSCPFKVTYGSDQMLFRTVQDSLWLAVAAQHRSIAFPAIGTGNLGFFNQEAAQIMMNAVWLFAQSSPVQIEVHFIIFPSDYERFKVFEAELNVLRPKAIEMKPPQRGSAEGTNEKPTLPSAHEQGWTSKPQKALAEPCLRLQSSSERSRAEAETWLQGLFNLQYQVYCIINNFTQLLGETELEEMSQIEADGVTVEEFLEKGRSGLGVHGDRVEDIVVTALKLQEILQTVQRRFLKEEVEELKREAQMKVKMERSPVSSSDPQLKPIITDLKRLGLQIKKIERVENRALEEVFKQRRSQMSSRSSWCMLQLVPAQFCDLVSHVGFRPQCAPPDDCSLGEGLYFAADVHTALSLWPDRSERFLYLFVADVLKGKCGRGKPGLVLAPSLDSGPGSEPRTRCDSVESGTGITVVFDHRQSLPRFILTCIKDSPV